MSGLTGTNQLPAEWSATDEAIPAKKGKRHYLREFVSWDGEGITYEPGTPQSYVLFGCSHGMYIRGHDLSTRECLDHLLHVKAILPDALHVGFSTGYDINMILRDLPREKLWGLYTNNHVKWEGYYIERIPGKWFTVRRAGRPGIRLYDVFGFFQSSFVVACEKFLGANHPLLEGVREGKSRRSDFTYDQLSDYVMPYWQKELELLVQLMNSLRDDLNSAGLRITSWHGPGAVANTVFRKFNIQSAKAEAPEEVNRAAQYAYAGGRFELFRCGHHPSTVWEYDINSAYPSAIAGLPSLSEGNWRYATEFEPDSFGVWKVVYDAPGNFHELHYRPQPLFYRDKHGGVSYPCMVESYVWTPEAALVPDYVVGGWVFDHDEKVPFEFVQEMYETRKEWKREGNSAERALKLALNSLYGKMAQRVGAVAVAPKWHQLEWAGFVTSTTRATLWDAISMNPGALLAVETDAIFSTSPLTNLPIGSGLGQWEVTEFDWITYIQNGLYYAGSGDNTLERYRGFDKGSLPLHKVHGYLRELDEAFEYWKVPPLVGQTTRFIGMGLGLRTRAQWRAWETSTKLVTLGGGGKRAHIRARCSACRSGLPFTKGLHQLVIARAGGRSFPHTLPWIDENSGTDLRLLEDMHRERY